MKSIMHSVCVWGLWRELQILLYSTLIDLLTNSAVPVVFLTPERRGCAGRGAMLLGGLLPLLSVWPIILVFTCVIPSPLSTKPGQLAATLVAMALVAADGALPAPAMGTHQPGPLGHVFFAQLLYGGGREVVDGDGYLRLPPFTAGFGAFSMLVALSVHTVNMVPVV